MCDVTKDDEIARLFDELKSRLRRAARLGAQRGFAPPDELKKFLSEHYARRLRIGMTSALFADCGSARRSAAHDAGGGWSR